MYCHCTAAPLSVHYSNPGNHVYHMYCHCIYYHSYPCPLWQYMSCHSCSRHTLHVLPLNYYPQSEYPHPQHNVLHLHYYPSIIVSLCTIVTLAHYMYCHCTITLLNITVHHINSGSASTLPMPLSNGVLGLYRNAPRYVCMTMHWKWTWEETLCV